MASTTQDKLYETFVAVSGQQDFSSAVALDGGEQMVSTLSDTVKQIADLQAGSSTAQAAGSGSSGTSSVSTSSSGGSTVESIAATVLESGLGMVPLIVGLLGLFGGGGTPAPPALEKYVMPDRLYFEGADTGSDISGADYDQMGTPRAYRPAPAGSGAQTGATAAPGSIDSGGAASSSGATQITVNVQAMDSQSFLDHSSEIAQAVRTAMLNSNAINDVVNNL
jgi:hypothetical protein